VPRSRLWCHGVLAALTAAIMVLAPTAAHAAPTIGTAVHADVVAVVTDAQGQVISIDIYSPARGVSSAQLYGSLKAQGVRGLVDPATPVGVSPMEVGECTMHGAHAWGYLCGSNRWHWPGTHPQVLFIDSSSVAWPLSSAVATWNQSTALDSLWRSGSTPCSTHTDVVSPDQNCVWVYSGSYQSQSWVGHTHLEPIAGTHVIDWAEIEFNDLNIPAGDAHWHRETTCHESGHALGLDHNDYQTSCLYWTHTASRSNLPGQGDWEMLESIY
jgi:hypothetical protein